MAAVVAVSSWKKDFCKHHDSPRIEVKNEYQVIEAEVDEGDNRGGEPSSNTEHEPLKGEVYRDRVDVEEGDVIGIITMEDVIEELLQVPLYQNFYIETSCIIHCTDLNVDSSGGNCG